MQQQSVPVGAFDVLFHAEELEERLEFCEWECPIVEDWEVKCKCVIII